MSAVDAPPGLPFAGLALGEFRARRGPRRLARHAFILVCLASGTAMAIASRKLSHPAIEILLVGPLVTVSIAGLGLAVRRARVRIERGAVRWGWGSLGVGMARERLRRVTVYSDAVALEPRRGSSWFLSARDWDDFERFARAFRKAGIEVEQAAGRAPLAARMQSYGRVLDGLIALSLLASIGLLLLSLS